LIIIFPQRIRSQARKLHVVGRGGCCTSGSDDEEMKIPPKEVVEEVAEEFGLHLVWEDPNVNERANCNGPDANEDVDMDCT